MASVNPWLAAAIALLLASALPTWTALRGSVDHRLVAVQLTSVIAVLALVTLSIAFGQPSFLDLSLALSLLSLPGTLVLAIFLERWL